MLSGESMVMWGGAQRGTTAACFPYYYLRKSVCRPLQGCSWAAIVVRRMVLELSSAGSLVFRRRLSWWQTLAPFPSKTLVRLALWLPLWPHVTVGPYWVAQPVRGRLLLA